MMEKIRINSFYIVKALWATGISIIIHPKGQCPVLPYKPCDWGSPEALCQLGCPQGSPSPPPEDPSFMGTLCSWNHLLHREAHPSPGSHLTGTLLSFTRNSLRAPPSPGLLIPPQGSSLKRNYSPQTSCPFTGPKCEPGL